MKIKFSLTLLSLFTLMFSYSQDKIIVNPNAPEITFEKELIDMGTYEQYDDESSRCEFIFTNTGKEPLIIEKAKGSCGCTVPEWPKEPIAPGESAIMKINYDEKKSWSLH